MKFSYPSKFIGEMRYKKNNKYIVRKVTNFTKNNKESIQWELTLCMTTLIRLLAIILINLFLKFFWHKSNYKKKIKYFEYGFRKFDKTHSSQQKKRIGLNYWVNTIFKNEKLFKIIRLWVNQLLTHKTHRLLINFFFNFDE